MFQSAAIKILSADKASVDFFADESEGRTLQTACAYVPIDPRQEHAMDATINELWQAGYIVKSKVGTIAGETYKCDFDVEMTLDISRIAYGNTPDIVVLVSGDSDFIPIVLELRGRGIRVEVVAFEFTMSRQLARKSSGFINLDALIKSDDAAQEDFDDDAAQEDFAQSTSMETEDDHADSNN